MSPTLLALALFLAPPSNTIGDEETSSSARRTIELARAITVQVTGEHYTPRRRSKRWGGGFIVGHENVVLTCLHVVEGYAYLFVRTSDNLEHAARIVTVFPDLDLAVLQFSSSRHYEGVEVAPNPVSPGTKAVIAGFPGHNERSIIAGQIGSIRPDIIYAGVADTTPLISFEAHTMLGFSGGPVLTLSGEFVGMVVARTDGTVSLAVRATEILGALRVPRIPFNESSIAEGREPEQSPESLDAEQSLSNAARQRGLIEPDPSASAVSADDE